jgi:hypothetical protein
MKNPASGGAKRKWMRLLEGFAPSLGGLPPLCWGRTPTVFQIAITGGETMMDRMLVVVFDKAKATIARAKAAETHI